MRRVTTWLVGLALAVFLIGVSLVPLTIPAFTRVVSQRTSRAADAGLPIERMVQIAEQVRGFVIEGEDTALPVVVDGRSGFDAVAVSHLLDVHRVLDFAGVLTGVLALGLALGLAFEVSRKRIDHVADALTAGAICSVVLVAACLVAAVTNFDWFFSAFHGLFFKAGTWTFDYDSLLIETFPETFWMTAGGVWAGLVLVGSGVLAIVARELRRGSA